MNHLDVRRGIAQHEVNQSGYNFVFLEIILISLFVGLANKSWWLGGGLLLGLIIIMFFKWSAIIFAVLMTAFWTYLCFNLLGGIGPEGISSDGMPWVISIFVMLISAGAHFTAFEYNKDITHI